jgi:hypothetical protein
MGVAVALMYIWSPKIAMSTPAMPKTISVTQVSVRFQLFDTIPPLRLQLND